MMKKSIMQTSAAYETYGRACRGGDRERVRDILANGRYERIGRLVVLINN